MALLTSLRNYTNPSGVSFNASNTDRLYAEDMVAVKNAIQDGSKGIKTERIELNGLIDNVLDSDETALKITANGTQTSDLVQMFASDGTTHRFSIGGDGQVLAVDGSNSTPAYSFANDTDTGIWRFSSGGQDVLVLKRGGGNVLAIGGVGSSGFWNVLTGAFQPLGDNTRDIGTSSNQIQSLYFGTSILSPNNGNIGDNGSNNPTNLYLDGQCGIGGSPDANAILDLQSTTKAFLPPRVTTTQRDNIASPVAGMVIYSTTNSRLEYYNGTSWGAV